MHPLAEIIEEELLISKWKNNFLIKKQTYIYIYLDCLFYKMFGLGGLATHRMCGF